MSKVYILRRLEITKAELIARTMLVVGIVSKKEVAEKWREMTDPNCYYEFELDDPELLNRIAKGESDDS